MLSKNLIRERLGVYYVYIFLDCCHQYRFILVIVGVVAVVVSFLFVAFVGSGSGVKSLSVIH